MHNWSAGEEVTAGKLNQLNPEADNRLSQAEHNILELYLENYFSSKNTPFQGLFFDGFSDSNKVDTGGDGLALAASAGQAAAFLKTSAGLNGLNVGDKVSIYDSANSEEKTVAQKESLSNYPINNEYLIDGNGWTFSSSNCSSPQSSGTTSRLVQFGSANAGWMLKIAKTVSVANGASQRLLVNCNMYAINSGMWNSNQHTVQLKINGVAVQSFQTGSAIGWASSVSFDYTWTPNSDTITVELVITGSDNYGSNTGAEWYGFQITIPTAYKVTFDSNLENSYTAATGYLKKTTATIETGNKRLGMTAGVGNLKKVIYQSVPIVFTQLMAKAKIWIMRKPVLQLHPNGSIAQSSNQLTVKAGTGSFMNGDAIDLITPDKLTRERKTVSNASEAGGGTLTLGTHTTASKGNSTNTMTYSKTVASGNNRCLVVGVLNREDSALPTTVAFNGLALTKAEDNASISPSYSISVWKLENPPVTTANVVITWAAAKGSSIFSDAMDFSNFGGFATPYKVNASSDRNHQIPSSTNGYCVLYIAYTGDPQGVWLDGANSGPAFKLTSFAAYIFARAATGVTTGFGLTQANYGVAWNAFGIGVLGLDPDIALTFSPAVSKSGGFSVDDYVERVDALPQISIVGSAELNNYEAPIYQESAEVAADGEVYTEDEYEYIPATPKEKVQMKIELTKGNTGLQPYAKRLGVSLNT